MKRGIVAAVLCAIMCTPIICVFPGCGGRTGSQNGPSQNALVPSDPSGTPPQFTGPTGRARLTILFPRLSGDA